MFSVFQSGTALTAPSNTYPNADDTINGASPPTCPSGASAASLPPRTTAEGIYQEDPRYADMVLLTTKRHGGLTEDLIKVPKKFPNRTSSFSPAGPPPHSRHQGSTTTGTCASAAPAGESQQQQHQTVGVGSASQFDFVTCSAFDMVDVSSPTKDGRPHHHHHAQANVANKKAVPRYIAHRPAGAMRMGRVSSEEEWIVVSSHSTPTKVC